MNKVKANSKYVIEERVLLARLFSGSVFRFASFAPEYCHQRLASWRFTSFSYRICIKFEGALALY